MSTPTTTTTQRPAADLLLHVVMFALTGAAGLIGLEVLRTRMEPEGIAQFVLQGPPLLPAVVLDHAGWIVALAVLGVLGTALLIDETRRRRRLSRRRALRAEARTRRGRRRG